MGTKLSIFQRIAWIPFVCHMLFAVLLGFLYLLMGVNNSLVLGALTYFILTMGLREVPQAHRKGNRNCKMGFYREAIPQLEKALAFFEKHTWLDRHRHIFLLNLSRMSHREIDLCNIALCYNKTGNSEKAEHYYNLALEEFPGCVYAKSALERMHPAQNRQRSKSRGKHKTRAPRKR